MILIAEAGGTKTDWCVIDRNPDGSRTPDSGMAAKSPVVLKFRTDGINMASMSEDLILSRLEMAAEGLNAYNFKVEKVHFFGAGLVDGPVKRVAETLISRFFPDAQICCESDLMAAARALFGDGEGIAAILGTGSNSCVCDGKSARSIVRSGGFILGDEGSAATLGKMLIADYIKGIVPEDIRTTIDAALGHTLTYEEIVTNVYKNPAPAAYLASFAPLVFDHLDNVYCEGLVRRNMEDFVTRVLVRYDIEHLPVGVAGTYGKVCRPFLEEAGKRYGIRFTKFISSPMEELIKYYV